MFFWPSCAVKHQEFAAKLCILWNTTINEKGTVYLSEDQYGLDLCFNIVFVSEPAAVDKARIRCLAELNASFTNTDGYSQGSYK